MPLTVAAFISVLFVAVFVSLAIGAFLATEAENKWVYCADELPPDTGRAIVNYPVAFFDEEFGIVVDQAEYHPHRAAKWLMVPHGEQCRPFAWYDLPTAPHPRIPQDIGSRPGVDTYA